MTSVHVFDGNLLEVLIPYRTKLQEIANMTPILKKEFINKFRDLFSNNAKRTIDIICSLNGNEETSNMLNALDVLYLALTIETEASYIKSLDEQLSDVVGPGGGTCASGRTTRIIQLYIQFVESKDMNVQPHLTNSDQTAKSDINVDLKK
jgi:hypothetical protein